MSTEDPVESGFESNCQQIELLLMTFHREFLEENTNKTDNMANVQSIPGKLTYIHATLKAFIAWSHEATGCEEVDTQLLGIIKSNMNADKHLRDKVFTLLKNLCPLIVPWNANTNAKVGHFIQLIVEYPFSPNASHR